jgi:integrase
VKSIRPSEILEWLRALEKTHSTSVQARAFHIVQSTFDLAVADGLRKDNPAKSSIIPRIEIDREERDPWPVETVWAVVDQHPEPYRGVPLLAAGCGMRQGEAFGIAVKDFDFEGGKVTISRQIARVGSHVVFKLPKGDKTRTVPLSPGVARTIKAFIEDYPPVTTTLPWMDGRDLCDPVTAELLFMWRGQLLTPPISEGAKTNAGRGRQKTAEGKNLRVSVYNTLVEGGARAGRGDPAADQQRAGRAVVRRVTRRRDACATALLLDYSAGRGSEPCWGDGVPRPQPQGRAVAGHGRCLFARDRGDVRGRPERHRPEPVPSPPRPRSTRERNRGRTGGVAVTWQRLAAPSSGASDQANFDFGRSCSTPSTKMSTFSL